jgi:hypothetical protein
MVNDASSPPPDAGSMASPGCTGGMLSCGTPAACLDPTDVHSCGSCGNDCTTLVGTAGAACVAGRCTFQCAAGHADCTGDGMGCTTDLTAPAHCGACGNDCTGLVNVSGATTCASAQCAFPASSCAPGYGDCNGDPSDGCEASLTTVDHCGACGTACTGSTPLCATSGGTPTCIASCAAPSPTLCGTSTCTDTTKDVSNCDTCGHTCTTSVAHAQATCAASACDFACNATYSRCSGACVDEKTDNANCGSCAHACTGGTRCVGGSCACPAGTHTCGSTCVSNSALTSCGATSCASCTAPTGGTATCDGTSCGTSCPSGKTLCGSACVDLNADTNNCGQCGNSCATSCSAGTCLWLMPNVAADIALGAPNPESYTGGYPQPVHDNLTGLTWRTADIGSENFQSEASDYCFNLDMNDRGAWRLPSLVELLSITDPNAPASLHLPADHSYLSTTVSGDNYWSAYSDGETGYDAIASDVLCVSATPAESAAPSAQDSFTIANGTAYDPKTKLTWQVTPAPTTYAQADAVTYCDGLSLDGGSWRLPTARELATIADYANVGATSATAAGSYAGTPFAGMPAGFFWSMTPYDTEAFMFQFVSHVGGAAEPYTNLPYGQSTSVTNMESARCVR